MYIRISRLECNSEKCVAEVKKGQQRVKLDNINLQ